MDPRPIGEILLAEGQITERDLEGALRYQGEIGALLGQALLRMGALSEEALLGALSRQLDLPVLGREHLPEDAGLYARAAEAVGVSRDWLLHHDAAVWFAVPGDADEGAQDAVTAGELEPILMVFARSPLEPVLMDTFERKAPGPVQLVLGSNRLLDTALASLRTAGRAESSDQTDDAQRLREMAEEAPVIDFVNSMFEDALRQRASDIHIEPFEQHFQVRFRIDGVLGLVQTLPRARFDAVASRIKLLSGMDIAERRLPQDGRQSVRFAGQDIDLRVSSLPGAWGESLVLRLLRKQQELPSLEGLGLDGASMRTFRSLVAEPNGVILVTGPTGSGKSTTLYRGLEMINDGARKIITIEDPVEYDMEGVTQVQARADIGYTFARGLRAILRQDPDVIMIGEIRDGETAAIAAQAALTGHLVFSTLHTNSALAAVERLIDLGVERFLCSAALRGLMGQRLVRQLCRSCAEPAGPEERQEGERLLAEARAQGARLPDIGTPDWKAPKGCPACANQGYSGRIAVYEAARITAPVRAAINAGGEPAALLAAARGDGFLTMAEDGLLKAARGLTSVAEVMRVVGTGSGPAGAAASAHDQGVSV
ncbi:GspE/PulE family protein [Maricaulis sp. CAU 1757]